MTETHDIYPELTGSEKQICWAKDILIDVKELIDRFPSEIREKHLNSYYNIESAQTVIGCRHSVEDWCSRVEPWLKNDGEPFMSKQGVCFDEPSVIRSVIF